MNKYIKTFSILFLAFGLAFTGCASSKKGQCGCPNKQGMVGYK